MKNGLRFGQRVVARSALVALIMGGGGVDGIASAASDETAIPLPPERPDPAVHIRPRATVPLPRTRPGPAPVPLPRERPGMADPKNAAGGCPELASAEIDAHSLGRIDEGSCEVTAAFEVSETGGVELSPPATLNCGMARRLDEFVSSVVAPAASIHLHTELVRLRVAASYVCRPRNNREDAEPSEHGQANAIDISRFTFADGRTVSVEDDWQDQGSAGDFLRAVHEAACGPFTTVIGPHGDRWHEDHFHFDLIERGPDGNTTYCR